MTLAWLLLPFVGGALPILGAVARSAEAATHRPPATGGGGAGSAWAARLLGTGLPGVPVADHFGRVPGVVSRTDLLRARATDAPLDLRG